MGGGIAHLPDHDEIKIVGYKEHFASDFARLNRDWLEAFDLLEPADLKHLDRPRESIIEPGGAILLAVDGGNVVGTCAILRIGPKIVELAKLAVAPEAQRLGIGRRLTLAAIDHALAIGAERMILVSNSKLVSAVRLYESLGFKHAPLPANLGYATANVYMELALAPPVRPDLPS
jgi:ribosomal protein S18 acetylase RimI-like enzyme